jgi:hypothetical protein
MQYDALNRSLFYSPYCIPSAARHSMGASLLKYLEIKIHPLVKQAKYSKLLVVGEYDRAAPMSFHEKDGKLSNWQRPTAVLDGDTLLIKCYPGYEYVRRYASLFASYFQITGIKNPACVSYLLPSEEQCWKPILETELGTVPVSDWLIIGSGIEEIANGEIWQGTDRYLWTQTQIGEKTATFLIFQHSFWGDILERLVLHLVALGHKRVIFTAKVGGIKEEHIPNASLATGGLSFVEGEVTEWDNIFADVTHPKLFKGDHFNSPSVLYEVDNWLQYMDKFHFVDSEIGHFARGAQRAKAEAFGYIHFISNRLSQLYPEDLSNERDPVILQKRELLKKDIRDIIEQVIR